jgi:peptidoglycan/LPS O-acetylase OafA/YrhL
MSSSRDRSEALEPRALPKRILFWALGTRFVSFGFGIMLAVQPQDPRDTGGQGMGVVGAFAISTVALLLALSAGRGWWQARREEDARPSPAESVVICTAPGSGHQTPGMILRRT